MATLGQLLRSRRMGPLFATQALGAFNDNVYKNALLIWIAFSVSQSQSNLLINAAAALFILPFFLFSAIAGQFADKMEKSALIRRIKLFEILVMAAGSVAAISQSIPLMLGVLALMGTQSAFFGPVKYGILPQHMHESELTAANGLVEMGTFLAILLGTIVGGMLPTLGDLSAVVMSVVVIAVAVAGYLSSRAIPVAAPTAPSLQIDRNPLRATWTILRSMKTDRTILLSVLGVSWFWAFGSIYLTQLPAYTRDVLSSGPEVVTLLLALFSIGVGAGSLSCEKLSGHKVEMGLVPFGSIGLSAAAIDLYFAAPLLELSGQSGVMAFVQQPGALRILVDITVIGLFGGIFIVPLYALIQSRADQSERSRIIAANNILNAGFMVVAAIFSAFALAQGLGIPVLLLTVAIMNIAVALFIYGLVPEFLLRFLVWIVINTLYRLKIEGRDNIPEEGPAVLTCNHVSFVDALILGGSIKRPVRFVMYWKIFNTPILSGFFRTIKAIPIAPRKESPEVLESAMRAIDAELAAGHLVCIFPEGAITHDGELQPFRAGAIDIAQRHNVPVIPMALSGLWGSFFSRRRGGAMQSLPRRFWSRISLDIGPAIPAADATTEGLAQTIAQMRSRP